MNSLYVMFFLVALLLFAVIVGVSWWQQKLKLEGVDLRSRRKAKQQLEDPSFRDDDDQADTILELDTKHLVNSAKTPPVLSNTASLKYASSSTGADDFAKPVMSNVTAGELAVEPSLKASDVNDSLPVVELSPYPAKDVGGTGTGTGAANANPSDTSTPGLATELVARVENTEPIEQQDLLTLFREYDFKFDRKVHIYGLNQLTDLWCDIEYELPSARFVELGLSIQLADPRGAMTSKELYDFQQMALELTNRFNASFEFSMDIDSAQNQAELLDKIGRRFDSMAVLNVVPKSKTGFRIADIESCARDLMMSTDKNGIFMKTRGEKHNLEVLYRLACTDGTGQFGIVGAGSKSLPVHDLVIYMNVPATPWPDRVFDEMIKDANSLATWLDGRVVDRNGRVVSQRSYTAIMKQIIEIMDGMHEEGLEPGDAVSRKLF